MRLDQYTKTKMQKHAVAFFLRLQHTNPFPAMAKDVVPDINDAVYNTYMSCLPEHIRNAVLLLMADECYVNILDKNTSSTLRVKVQRPNKPEELTTKKIIFNFSKYYPSVSPWGRETQLDPDHPMLEEIIQWIHNAIEINHDYAQCCAYLDTVIGSANTAGQLRTMFPEYVRILPGSQQQHIFNMQKRSRLPKDVDLGYLKKHRRFVAEKVALCLLLPEGGEKIWSG